MVKYAKRDIINFANEKYASYYIGYKSEDKFDQKLIAPFFCFIKLYIYIYVCVSVETPSKTSKHISKIYL